MSKTKTVSSSSSSDIEVLTIAYAESLVEDKEVAKDGSSDSNFSLYTTSSSSLDTPTSAESVSSQFAVMDHIREKGLYFGYEPVWRTMSTIQGPKLKALDYFWAHHVFQLFSFMMSHLLVHTPDDPVPFLLSLVERCIRYRDEDDEPPLLFQDSHVNSLYTALDPAGDGSITYKQYLVGMNTLGLTEFNFMPNEDRYDRNISKDVFLLEVRRALLSQLKLLLGKTKETSSMGTEQKKSAPNDNVDELSMSQGSQHTGSINSNGKGSITKGTYIVHSNSK